MIAKCLIISFTFNFSSSCPWASPSIVFRCYVLYSPDSQPFVETKKKIRKFPELCSVSEMQINSLQSFASHRSP